MKNVNFAVCNSIFSTLISNEMTKAEIAKTTGIEKSAVVTVIEQFMTVVKDSLAYGENVYLRGFGLS